MIDKGLPFFVSWIQEGHPIQNRYLEQQILDVLSISVNRCLTILRLDWSILHSERSSLLNKPSPELVNGGLMLHSFQHQVVQASRLSKLLEERLHLTSRSAND